MSLASASGRIERVDERVMGEEAAVVRRNIHVVIALVDLAEETEEIAPDRLGVPLVARLPRPIQQAVAHEVAPLREGDEENAVEDFLRRLYRRTERELRPVGGIFEKGDQPFAQIPVILVEPIGDVGVSGVCLAQEPLSRIAEKIPRAQNLPQAAQFVRLIEAADVEDFVGFTAAPVAVEPYFDAVRHQHPFGARRVVGVFPGLLHRRLAPARHDVVEVLGVGAFQFERRDDCLHPARGVEMPERGIPIPLPKYARRRA